LKGGITHVAGGPGNIVDLQLGMGKDRHPRALVPLIQRADDASTLTPIADRAGS
jgi:hypothetical protein